MPLLSSSQPRLLGCSCWAATTRRRCVASRWVTLWLPPPLHFGPPPLLALRGFAALVYVALTRVCRFIPKGHSTAH